MQLAEPGGTGSGEGAPPDRPDRALFRISFGVLAVGLLVVNLARIGLGPFPGIDLDLRITKSLPAVPRLGIDEQFALYSPIGLVVARVLRISTRSSWLVLHGVVLVGGLGVELAWCRKRYGDLVARFVVITWSSSAVPVVLFGWLGAYDVFSVILSTALVLSGSTIAAALIGFLLAFTNFEQSIVSVGVLAGLAAFGLFGRVKQFVAAGAGLLVGRLILTAYLRANDATSDRMAFLQAHNASGIVQSFLSNSPMILATAFGAAALLLIATALRDELPTRDRVLWLAAFLPAFAVAMFGLDQTRVVVLINWPILLGLAITVAQTWPRASVQRLGTAMVAMTLMLPAVFVWDGRVETIGWANLGDRLNNALPP